MQMISIICAYNDPEVLTGCLINSLKYQDAPYQLIAIDNTDGKYKSAPVLLNKAAEKAIHDYIMFVHQDVALRSRTWLSEAEKQIRFLDSFGAAGVAGKDSNGVLHASVWNGFPPWFVGSKKLTRPVTVQTVDGCLMVVPRQLFKSISFDAETCPGWYFYIANYCLDLARSGYKVYVLPHEIYHKSTGPSNQLVYQETVQNMARKHCDHVKVIYTTVFTAHTEPLKLVVSKKKNPLLQAALAVRSILIGRSPWKKRGN